MSNTVNINIAATDNGTLDVINSKAKNLNKNLTDAQNTAKNLSRSAGQTFAAQKAMKQIEEGFEYRQARGGRGTGAEGRDFAKQAQGLGGLVHVYATFAANLFAVSAAFNALSKAADYTNMIAGLDQLGAASGKNLSAVAKNLTLVTDGAVSLREAVAATAQANAAGMSADQIDRMGKVAKTAAQALGRDTPDALNRLSRGITKIEPELLDELGIFVRVDKAARDYARTVGKTAASLSEFERRQAFANAVLEQGEEKFGKISLAANQYSKLQASFINIMYQAGEAINYVLSPLVAILANSQVALGALITGIVSLLLNKAIPALKGWRDNIRAVAKESEELIKGKIETAKAERVRVEAEARTIAEAKAEAELNTYEKKRQELENRATTSRKGRLDKETRRILDTEVQRLSEADFKYLDKKLNAAKSDKMKGVYADLISSLRRQIALEEEATKAVNKHNQALLSRGTITEQLNAMEARQLQRKSSRQGVVSSAVDAFSSRGWIAGWAEYDKKVAEYSANMAKETGAKFGRIDKILMRTSAGVGMVVSGFSKFINVFGFVGAAIAAVYGTFELLNAVFSKNSEKVEKYNSKIEELEGSLKTYDNTVELIRNKDPLEKLSVESIQAKITALKGLTDSIGGVVKALRSANESANWWDRFVDSWKDGIGLGLGDVAVNKTSASLSKLLSTESESKEKTTLEDEIKKIIGTDNLTSNALKSSLDKILDTKTSAEFLDTLDKIDSATKKYSDSIQKARMPLITYSETTKNTVKTLQDLQNSFIPTDNMSKFGMAQEQQALRLAEALKDPKNAIIALSDAVNDLDLLSAFPPEIGLRLNSIKEDLNNTRSMLASLDEALTKTSAGINELEGASKTRSLQEEERAQLDYLKIHYTILKETQDKYLEKAGQVQKDFSSTAMSLYEVGSKRVQQSLIQALASGANAIKQNIARGIDGIGGIKIREKLQLEAIDIQKQSIIAQTNLVIETKRLALAYEKESVDRKISNPNTPEKERAGLRETSISLGEAQKLLDGSYQNIINNITNSGDLSAKINVQGLVSMLVGASSQLASLGSQATQVKDTAKLDINAKKREETNAQLDRGIKSISSSKESLKSEYELSNLYDENIENQLENYRIQVRIIEAQKEKNIWEEKTLEYGIQKSRLSGKALADLEEERKKQEDLRNEELEAIKRINAEEDKAARWQKLDREVSSRKEVLNLQQRQLELDSQMIDIADKSGLYRQSDIIMAKLGVELTKIRLNFESEALDLKNQINKAENEHVKKLLQDKLDKQTQFNSLLELQVRLQAEYEAALVKTGEDLKRMERMEFIAGDNYFKSLSDNLSDKLSLVYKNAKSAGETFADGLIEGIDAVADKYFEMLKAGEFTLKNLGNFVKDTVVNLAYDTIKQGAKNEIYRIFKDILGPSEADKKAEEIKAAASQRTSMINYLSQIATNTSKTIQPYIASNDPYEKNYENEMDKASDEVAKTNKQTAGMNQKLVSEQNTIFGQLGQAISMIPGPIGQFGRYIILFGQAITSMSLFKGGGMMDSIGSFGKSLGSGITDLVGSAWGGISSGASSLWSSIAGAFLAAKGGVFSSDSLSKHSNSIVTSPTQFAFAKGGIPSFNRGIMGEAGPEAIMPLKRDANGILGIRAIPGTTHNNTNSNTTNLTINVSAPGGDPAEVKRSTAAASRALLATLNGARRYG